MSHWKLEKYEYQIVMLQAVALWLIALRPAYSLFYGCLIVSVFVVLCDCLCLSF